MSFVLDMIGPTAADVQDFLDSRKPQHVEFHPESPLADLYRRIHSAERFLHLVGGRMLPSCILIEGVPLDVIGGPAVFAAINYKYHTIHIVEQPGKYSNVSLCNSRDEVGHCVGMYLSELVWLQSKLSEQRVFCQKCETFATRKIQKGWVPDVVRSRKVIELLEAAG